MENNIQKYRLASGLSQSQLGNTLGVPQGTVGNWERGLREPNLATIKKLAEALNCKPADLYPVLEG
ncbi:helix-turn-helix transcriptional regulator [Mannheimia sp. HC-2023]|uniref:helix-turn-helix transcriptional regulator n=1 Tax=Mannheimia indoligenes TaxID=3103145 RepID=UPI002FE5F00F